MTVRVLPFARVREILGFASRDIELPPGATARDAWAALVADSAALRTLERSTRLARNGVFVAAETPLGDGDELALLPPVGGG
jgi:molybdopterin converting factor small subunit